MRHADEAELRRHLLERGVSSMQAYGLAKVESGTTSLSEVLRMGAILSA
ncbi:MAG: hypothetical protein JJU25_03155 [Halomonas sp.]|nr:hypothetical protein [Halomonas sp.]MCC5881622.1 hypothetical protein [Halomonas sp.]